MPLPIPFLIAAGVSVAAKTTLGVSAYRKFKTIRDRKSKAEDAASTDKPSNEGKDETHE